MLSALTAWILSLWCRYCGLIVHDYCQIDSPYNSLYHQTNFLSWLDGRFLKEQTLSSQLRTSTSPSDDLRHSSNALTTRSAQIGDICAVQGQRS